MSALNLVTDAWIPVRTTGGERRTIRPDQIAEPGVARPDWPRADFNLATYELLIGLVHLADPPGNERDWSKRRAPDPERLGERMAPFAPAFELDGDGPRFLQDLKELDGKPSEVDLLFIDSAGESTAKKNADLMVRRERYGALSLPEAAMSLYTLQSQAPSGGAGNRTSMRGGGPLVTLVEPRPEPAADAPLWDMVWANVPDGEKLPENALDAFAWMRPTVTSEKGNAVHETDRDRARAEAFFGMPRRLRLVFSDGEPRQVIGVRQRPFGTNYGLWQHPLTPYYRQKAGAEALPVHPRPGIDSYRNWTGIAFMTREGLREVASTVAAWGRRNNPPRPCALHLGGWAMDNMKPRDFLWSRQPLFPLDEKGGEAAAKLVEAANAFALALSGALRDVTGADAPDASAIEPLREAFYARTQDDFETILDRLAKGETLLRDDAGDVEPLGIAEDWRRTLRSVGLSIFDSAALPGLDARGTRDIERIVAARGRLLATFAGHGDRTGKVAFDALGLPLPSRRNSAREAA